jgi:DNA-directed RNA polymerase specialized sigma24 family protein
MSARDERPTRRTARRSSARDLASVTPIDGRRRIAAALRQCTPEERVVLALLLFERLTPPEAADALGVSPRQLERVYNQVLRDLDGAMQTPPRRSRRPRPPLSPITLRKAS